MFQTINFPLGFIREHFIAASGNRSTMGVEVYEVNRGRDNSSPVVVGKTVGGKMVVGKIIVGKITGDLSVAS